MSGNHPERLAEWLRRLEAGLDPGAPLHSVLDQFGECDYIDARPVVERYLADADPFIRAQALQTLTIDLQLIEHWETARRMLLEDPDVEVRMMAAGALAFLAKHVIMRPTLASLARIVEDRSEPYAVRQAAYSDILEVVRYDPRETLRLATGDIDLEKEVDWSLVDACVHGAELSLRSLPDRPVAEAGEPRGVAEADDC